MQSHGLILVRRGIRRGMQALWRERGWGMGASALALVFLLFQFLLAFGVALRHASDGMAADIPLRIEVRQEAAEQDVQRLFGALQDAPGVADAAYVTREQALERARSQDPSFIAFLEGRSAKNVFRDSFSITLRSSDDAPQLFGFLREADRAKALDAASFLGSQEDWQGIGTLQDLARAMGAGILAAAAVASIALVLVLAEVLRRRALLRQEEVRMERLAGGGDFLILLPFATEGFLFLLPGFIATLLLCVLGPLLAPALPPLQWMPPFIGDGLGQAPIFPFLGVELLLSPVIAFVAAWLGVRGMIKEGR